MRVNPYLLTRCSARKLRPPRIEPYVRVVRINKADAVELDTRLRLKTAMPPSWQFGRGCMYARLHELDIAFEAPKDGPWCSCGATRESGS
jgi:hypothetical protein